MKQKLPECYEIKGTHAHESQMSGPFHYTTNPAVIELRVKLDTIAHNNLKITLNATRPELLSWRRRSTSSAIVRRP